ncbi:MAG: L-threonylcarbamoyladenylate synthase [Saprospiraceae bacterium]
MIGKDIKQAIEILKKEELVGIPTETVYGLGGNALSSKAVAEIFRVKNRPSFDPLIIHTDTLEKVKKYVAFIPDQAMFLAREFMPGSLTLLLPKNNNIPDLVTSGSSLVAVRLPNHSMTLELLSELDFPLAAPSANPFGYISPTTAQHVNNQLGEKIPYILDGGPCEVGLESTIVGFEGDETIIFRKGGLAVEAIEELIGSVKILNHSTSNPQTPGQLKSHYAPKTDFEIGDPAMLIDQHQGKKIGIISFSKSYEQVPIENQIILSKVGDFSEAARNLFAGMRHLDSLGLDLIIAALLPEKDLGRAINDRLKRAAA